MRSEDCTPSAAVFMITPMRRIRPACCARAATGHAAAAPPSSVMNSRRSFDHLVGAGEKIRRYVDIDRLYSFKLMTSSNLVGFCTGRSAGFSPLRMRST